MTATQFLPDSCVLLGGGNHSKVVIEAMEAAGVRKPVAIVDADVTRVGQVLHGVPIVGDDSCLTKLIHCGVNSFAVGVGSSGNTNIRQFLFELARTHGLEPVTIQHPTAIVSPTAAIGAGTQILSGAIVSTNCVVGENVILNTGAIVDHDCVVEDHVHIATGARLAGGVLVKCGAHIGIGATIKQQLNIGSSAIVGAGAVVVRNVPSAVVVTGVPARELRKIAA